MTYRFKRFIRFLNFSPVRRSHVNFTFDVGEIQRNIRHLIICFIRLFAPLSVVEVRFVFFFSDAAWLREWADNGAFLFAFLLRVAPSSPQNIIRIVRQVANQGQVTHASIAVESVDVGHELVDVVDVDEQGEHPDDERGHKLENRPGSRPHSNGFGTELHEGEHPWETVCDDCSPVTDRLEVPSGESHRPGQVHHICDELDYRHNRIYHPHQHE